ncbi:MAG: hypothetical protein JO022_17990 [Acidobacteriaceae bacterium]|nr:hypothetical protein [Acidobacteriaceae bacterium]
MKGTINAFTSDYAFGAGRINSGNSDFRTGQAIGDAIAIVTGTAEALFGGGEAVVTSPAALTVAGAVIPAAGAATAVHGGTTAAIAGSHLTAAAFADNNQQSSGSSEPDRTAGDPLRRDPNGKAVPDPEASGTAHTQLGTRQSKSQPGTSYKQAREFYANGKPVKDIDFTNHGRSDHLNPHASL